MCMASVSDCSALAAAQPVDVTKARIPWFISSQAAETEEGRRKNVSGGELLGPALHVDKHL